MGSYKNDDSDSDRSVVIKQEARSPSPNERRTSRGQFNPFKHREINNELIRTSGFRHKHSIEEYVKKRESIEMVDPTRKESALDPEDLVNDDEEVWLIQCPRDVSVESLIGAKLNLDGDRHKVKGKGDAATIEYTSEAIDKPRLVSVMCKTKSKRKAKHHMVSVKPVGIVRVQNKLQEPTDAEIVPTKQVRVPYPTDIKVRHPLHGIHFTDRTQLPAKVLQRLNAAVAASNVARSQVEIKQEPNVDMEVDTNDGRDTTKKTKKRKAPKVEPVASDAEEEAPKKAKRSKKIKVEENDGVNLDWLAAI